jgi:sugar phosphate isomerase/epimerase
MSDRELNRRGFMKSAIGAAAVGAAVGNALAAPQDRKTGGTVGKPIRLGGPIEMKKEDPEELALAHRKLNYRGAYCPGFAPGNKEVVKDIEKAFAKHDVVIAEVGRWCNLMDHRNDERKKNTNYVIEGLALAEEVGAKCCVNIAGSYCKDPWYGLHEDNLSDKFFDQAVETARKIIDAVKPKRTAFCYEMMGWALPDSPDAYLKMLKAIDRPAFAVHLDPCNLINSPRRFFYQDKLIRECYEKLGKWIVSCHIKDLTWQNEMSVHFMEVTPGTGRFDHLTYLKQAALHKPEAPIMLEHCANQEEYEKARKHLLALGDKNGIKFA